MKLTWKEVFNTRHLWYGHIEEAMNAASRAGYPYFNWNGVIYLSTGFRPQSVMFETEVQ